MPNFFFEVGKNTMFLLLFKVLKEKNYNHKDRKVGLTIISGGFLFISLFLSQQYQELLNGFTILFLYTIKLGINLKTQNY